MLMMLAFVTVSAVLGKSTLRGLTSLFIGLAMGLVGLDQISGPGALHRSVCPRCSTAWRSCLIAVGLFAVAEALYVMLYEGKVVRDAEQALARCT